MFFRNIVLFALPEIHRLDLETLENVLSAHALKPVGPLAMQSRGFVPPLGSGAYVQRAGHSLWLSLGGEDRILPSAVVHREWQAKIAKLEDTKGHPLGKRARSQLKQDTLEELMPRAFVKPSHTHAVIDPKAGIIAIDTSSVKAAEAVVSKLREAFGSFPALPLQTAQSPRAMLTRFLLGEALPEHWFLGEECELTDPAEKGAVVKCLRSDLASEEVLAHLHAGKQVTRLAVLADAQLACVIGDDLVLRKFKLLEAAVDGLENANTESVEDELMARFALFGAELARFYAVFAKAFGVSAKAA